MPNSPDSVGLVGDRSANPSSKTIGGRDLCEKFLVSMTSPFLILGYYTAVTVLKIAGCGSEGLYLRDSVPNRTGESRVEAGSMTGSDQEHKPSRVDTTIASNESKNR
jgi:hypothetical protein